MWKVMLADDEKSIRTALGTLIDWQSLDCEVVYMARSGQDVLDHIGQYRPDLLITDIRMPGVDGVELANRLSGSELPIPIIFLTAYTDFSYAQAAVRYSVADYIVKPNVLEELPQAIRRIQERFGMQPAEQRRRIQQEVLRALLDDTFTVEEQPRANLAAYAQLKSGGGPFQLIVVQDLSGQLRRLAKTCFAQWDAVMFSVSANEFAFLLMHTLPERAQIEQACGALLGFSSSLLQMVAGVCVSEPFPRSTRCARPMTGAAAFCAGRSASRRSTCFSRRTRTRGGTRRSAIISSSTGFSRVCRAGAPGRSTRSWRRCSRRVKRGACARCAASAC